MTFRQFSKLENADNGNKIKILIIEDEAISVAQYNRRIKQMSDKDSEYYTDQFDIVLVNNKKEAEALLCKNNYDLIFLDDQIFVENPAGGNKDKDRFAEELAVAIKKNWKNSHIVLTSNNPDLISKVMPEWDENTNGNKTVKVLWEIINNRYPKDNTPSPD